MRNEQTISLDLSKTGPGEIVTAGQGDSSGTTITAEIYDNGDAADLSGSTAWLVVLLPDREHYYRGACSVSGSSVSCTVDESKLCSVAGYTDEAYFTFTQGGKMFSTERFAIEIYRSALDGQEPSENWDAAVDDLIARGEAAVSAANEAAADANSSASSADEAADDANDAAANANAATELASAATTAASGAASTANDAAQSAISAAANIESMIRESLGGLSDIGDIGGALDRLARESCSGGIYVSGTWYVKSSAVEWDGTVLTVHGSRPDDGRMHLPTTRCRSEDAYELARSASEAVSTMSATVEGLLESVGVLTSAVRSLALAAGSYPVVVGETMYLRGVTYSAGRLTVPAASLSAGKMLISKH